ncbi:MAG: DUF1800 family protein [Bryobacterales bacterium]|nr:DUF1800 family protein [Bryobacterales bacterium]
MPLRQGWIPAVLALLALGVPAYSQIEVYHKTASVEIGTTRQFSAYVPLSPNTVVWSVNGIAGGNATIGTVSGTGLFRAPATAPTPSVVSIRATSTAFPDKYGEATVTITRPTPYIWSSSPSQLGVGSFEIRLNGANFNPDAQVRMNGVPLTTVYLSSTSLRASGAVAATGTVGITVFLPGPGAVSSQPLNLTVAAPSVTVMPSAATLLAGASRAFTASVPVVWQVNGVTGGNSATGLITPAGVYTAPATAQTVTVRGASTVNAAQFGTATVTVTAAPVTVTPPSATVSSGGSVTFAASVPVVWQVNGVTGGSAATGLITPAGVYTAPETAQMVTVRGVSTVYPANFASASVTVTGPPPAVSLLSAGRLLEQAAFGPRPADLTKVQQIGINGWLDEQFAMPETAIPDQASTAALRDWKMHQFVHASDQLRQRVTYALDQLIVTSLSKLNYANEMLPAMRVMQRNAFGNYRTLLREITLSPSMGKYLDLANSTKPTATSAANENYPRELMQLFTIGLYELNNDGSQKVDGNGIPIATYDQQTVRQVALALTGWTYATAPGGQAGLLNWENFTGDLEPRPAYHDTTAKSFLGCTLPANQTIQQDLEATIDCVFQHPNLPPFLATRLVRSLVKSNPSPAYIGRVAAVFINNGAGVRGDLKAVVRAILTDSEARQETPDATSGRLKEPLYFISSFLRATNGSIATNSGMAYVYVDMGQAVLSPPSVFNWFSPLYRVPKSSLFGPEFQIYTPTEATLRANFVYQILTANGGNLAVDLSNLQALAGNTPALLDEIDRVFFYGRMPAGVRGAITNAVTAAYDNNQRVQAAVYLATLSGQYAVQY